MMMVRLCSSLPRVIHALPVAGFSTVLGSRTAAPVGGRGEGAWVVIGLADDHVVFGIFLSEDKASCSGKVPRTGEDPGQGCAQARVVPLGF